ncbi:Host-nuclease inhibitor protein Gam [uncultured Caudovirales phage]|uniref:Host-nuclease inhibitor protein Gam n=1 Tax=uncultured Caudovirales phage TaxID=2100421 RepID=A0A6J5NCD2_9CAUD|nr:Host-nuclease inhibitor protein Gam [uncultured Caudovirales phage]
MATPEINEFDSPAISSISSENEGFIVDTDQKADWAIRKLAVVRKKQAENKVLHDAEVARIADWLSMVNTALERDALYFEAVLKPYALTQRTEGRKSITLPHGTIKTTAGQPKVEFKDEAKFIEWAQANDPTLLKVKTDIDKTAVKALITEEGVVISTQGEIVPDVEVIPAETSVKFVTE